MTTESKCTYTIDHIPDGYKPRKCDAICACTGECKQLVKNPVIGVVYDPDKFYIRINSLYDNKPTGYISAIGSKDYKSISIDAPHHFFILDLDAAQFLADKLNHMIKELRK